MMNVLEKILEDIESLKMNLSKDGTLQCYWHDVGLDKAKSVVKKHMDEAENGGWIPVEERLPEESGFIEDSYIVQKKNVIDPFSAYWDGKEWTDVNDDKVEEVIAWRPLPEPYKPKEKVKISKNSQQELEDFWMDR